MTGTVGTLIPQRLVGDGKRVLSDVDDNVTLIVEWETGQQGVVRTLWGTSFTRNDTAVYGRRGTLWVNAGRVILHSPDKEPEGGEPIEWQGFSDCFRMPIRPETPNESIIDHFAASIQHGLEPRCSGRLQLHVHEILFQGYEAAAQGRTVELNTTFEPWHHVDPAFYDTRSEFI